jgi:hypothetical protein
MTSRFIDFLRNAMNNRGDPYEPFDSKLLTLFLAFQKVCYA